MIEVEISNNCGSEVSSMLFTQPVQCSTFQSYVAAGNLWRAVERFVYTM